MTDHEAFPIGVIEGFYGRPWSHKTRLAYAGYMQRLGLNSYLYCPKADPFLRKRWQENWPNETRVELIELAQTYSAHGIDWGVGLSPFALYQDYNSQNKRLLKGKVESLAALGMPTLAVLFDDMPGALAELASRQAEIIADICAWAPATRVIVCPTYYSFDPVLEKYFGAMPSRYWYELGRDLPSQVDVFWTGNRVCSETVSAQDIELINEKLGRKVMLWDNYPVNDGAVRSNFIYSQKLSGRDPALAKTLKGHYCNPMNQAQLSLMALAGLAELYERQSPAVSQWLSQLFGADTWGQLLQDSEDFETLGLSGMGEERCRELADLYGGYPGSAAKELAGWLRGEYTFDPDCLTD